MRIEYIGQFEEVRVPYLEDGLEREVTFRRGESVDVPEELARGVEGVFGGLLEQVDNYRESPTKRRGNTEGN